MSFERFKIEHQRLAILRVLAEDAAYATNESVLEAALEALGHGIGSDRLRTELHWLSEQGLIGVKEVAGLQVARLTRRGEDVARGIAQAPGVARPRPGR